MQSWEPTRWQKYPFGSIVQQARFKSDEKLGVSLLQRGTPRSSVRLQAEGGPKERNKIRFIQRMRKGAVIAEGVANGYTYTALAKRSWGSV
ncbi:hypothetical protein [Klebsiella quasipneumoniae]|uniref:hypothetical protein n=1 Tax=Klebsiella quasipneumoniae TaxID=1463165 RepID=UPI003890A310